MNDCMKTRKFNGIITAFVALSFILCLVFSEAVKEAIVSGIRLSVLSVIPTLFPFFVISDYFYKYKVENKQGKKTGIFPKLFGISQSGTTAFLLGTLCGVPIGAKCAGELYRDGVITKDEAERLTIISSTPSAAFTISVTGCGMTGSFYTGVLLYLSTAFASMILGLILGRKRKYSQFTNVISEQSFDFAESIKSAGVSSITVSSFIIFFSGAVGLFQKLVKNAPATLLFSVITEMGNGVFAISKSGISPDLKLPFYGFCLGFSGLSVFFQTIGFLPKDISKSRIFAYKILHGLLSGLLIFLIYSVGLLLKRSNL